MLYFKGFSWLKQLWLPLSEPSFPTAQHKTVNPKFQYTLIVCFQITESVYTSEIALLRGTFYYYESGNPQSSVQISGFHKYFQWKILGELGVGVHILFCCLDAAANFKTELIICTLISKVLSNWNVGLVAIHRATPGAMFFRAGWKLHWELTC